MYPVTLTGRRITLREFRDGDAPAAHAVLGDPLVTRWLGFGYADLADAERALRDTMDRARRDPRTEYHLVVTAPSDGVVGLVRLWLGGERAGGIGYAVRPDRWGRGYATDAARTLAGFAFGALGLHRVHASAFPDNVASLAVLAGLGMTYEGRIRDDALVDGEWRDSLLHSVLAPEWRAGLSRPPRSGAVPPG
ncbi:GNAT family N-acetyltransferase [Jidongwangia harbinensis]|uniref:GNAT family N-acetyltransferase n=1 Tax=Jidongwangia harbinensis TaxID=2878561 RepID=UPI001CD97A5E|nr:GNAT family protein [Jidongwangia harbinensis]MCA2213109.1 GNAT family N-acetyltransferase [Jidongwangia harbinensis]